VLVGVIDGLPSVPPGPRLESGADVVVLGTTRAELGGSEWARLHGHVGGLPPAVDLDAAAALHDLVRSLVNDRVVVGVHDCSDGGLAAAVAEMAIEGGCGATLELTTDLEPAMAWFSESASRVVVAVEPARLDDVLSRALAGGVPATPIGTAGGDRIVATGAFDIGLADATTAWRDAIPLQLGRVPA